MAKYLGDEMKRLRRARGLSTRIAAEQAGMPHMTYMGYEFGKAIPPSYRRPAIALMLGVPEQVLDDLVDEDESEVFLRARKLSDAGKDAIRAFLRKVREDERRQHGRS